MNKIAEGYKQTEVGVIPRDWEVKKLEFVADIILGQSPKGSSYNRNEKGAALINGPTEFTDRFPVKIQWTSEPTRFCQSGDTLLCVRGSSIGRINISNDRYCIGRGVAAIRAKDNCTQVLLEYITRNAVQSILSKTSGSTFPNIDSKSLRGIQIPLPPTKAEQTAIAAALNDADALITQLEKLIAKKRNIKQGAMQELLRPKEGWEVKLIEETFDVTAGGDFKKEFSSEIKDEKYKFPIYSNSLVDEGLYGYSSYYTSDSNCITVTARGTIGYANYRDHKFAAIGRVIVLRPKVEIDCFYVSEYINNRINFVLEVTGVPQLTAPQISKYTISLPKTKQEQSKISEILQDMDAEIEALEKKLEKYKMIKQGMMQELLTGKTRLI